MDFVSAHGGAIPAQADGRAWQGCQFSSTIPWSCVPNWKSPAPAMPWQGALALRGDRVRDRACSRRPTAPRGNWATPACGASTLPDRPHPAGVCHPNRPRLNSPRFVDAGAGQTGRPSVGGNQLRPRQLPVFDGRCWAGPPNWGTAPPVQAYLHRRGALNEDQHGDADQACKSFRRLDFVAGAGSGGMPRQASHIRAKTHPANQLRRQRGSEQGACAQGWSRQSRCNGRQKIAEPLLQRVAGGGHQGVCGPMSPASWVRWRLLRDPMPGRFVAWTWASSVFAWRLCPRPAPCLEDVRLARSGCSCPINPC